MHTHLLAGRFFLLGVFISILMSYFLLILFNPSVMERNVMKRMPRVCSLVFGSILLMAMPDLVEAADYYVATDGDNQNEGSLASPWRSIQHAVDTVITPDTIYVRGGIYTELVTFNPSGSAAAGYITLRNYPDEKPVIDGTGLNVSDYTGLLYLKDIAYVKIIGFELRNLTTSNSGATPGAIWIFGASHHIEIKDNLVHSIQNTSDDGNAHGIALYGDNATASINNVLIDGNEIKNCILGWSESLVLNGNVENFVVSNNIIHDNNNIGIDFIGHEGICSIASLDRARDGVCIGNTVYNIDTSTNPVYKGDRSGDGIYVDGGTNITVERNIVHKCNIGIEIASEHKGKDSSYITVKNNFVYDNDIMGISLGGYDTNRGSTVHCKVINNTCYKNDTAMEGNGELCLQYDTQNNEILNNIFYANNQNLFISNQYRANTGNQVDYNIYYSSGGANGSEWQWKGTTYNSLSAWQSMTGNDSNGMYSDPKLLNPDTGNLHISGNSPGVDQGTMIADLKEDIDGDSRPLGSGIDMGADEYQGSAFNPPYIKANGQDELITISSNVPVSIILSLDPDNLSGQNADWWVVESAPDGNYYYFDLSTGSMVQGLLPTHQGPLFSLGATQLLNSSFTVGTHTFYFAVDMIMNGSLDMVSIYYDSVNVIVQ